MLTLKQIDKAIGDLILNHFPNIEIQSTDVKEGFNRPSFFVKLDNPIRDTRLYSSNRSMTVRINYFPKSRKDYAIDLMDVQDELETVFNLNISIADRTITIDETRAQVIDGVLEFEFDLEFSEAVEIEDDSEIMEELELET